MKKKTERLLIGLGASVAAAVSATIVSNKLTKELVREAIDRNEPKYLKPIRANRLGAYFEKEPYKSAADTAEKLFNKPTETVEITANDGTKLIGHYYSCENPKRIVIAMHGWRSLWYKDFGSSSDFLHDNDCDVLYAEQRGQGNSGGEYIGFGMVERFDCLSWINWVVENKKDIPVYLLGISMGASTVLMTSGLLLPEGVKGIIADCGFTSAKEIFKHVAVNSFHIPYSVKQNEVENLCKEKINFGAGEYSTIDALKISKTPVLFIHGTDDKFVPISMTYENYKACVSPKRLFVVPGAEHGGSYLVDKEGYEKEVLDFFASYDN